MSDAKTTKSPSNVTIQELAKTSEFRWFVCHLSVFVSSVLYLTLGFFSNGKLVELLYRLVYVAALGAFGLIVAQKYRVSRPTVPELARDDNVHYLLLALLWLLTPRRSLSVVPFAIFSFFHSLTYTRTYLIPTLQAHPNPALLRNIDNIVKNYNEPLTSLASSTELVLLATLFLNVILFRKSSLIQFIGFLLFFRVRFAVSAYTRTAVHRWEVRIDNALPPAAREHWLKFKQLVASIPAPVTARPTAGANTSTGTSSTGATGASAGASATTTGAR